jgi:hypothetical protein
LADKEREADADEEIGDISHDDAHGRSLGRFLEHVQISSETAFRATSERCDFEHVQNVLYRQRPPGSAASGRPWTDIAGL